MASFQRRGKTWQYTISHKPKPIRKGGFRTKKEAQAAAHEVESQLRSGISVHAIEDISFAQYFNDWVSVYKSHTRKNTYERYQTSCRTIKKHFGSKPIQKITKVEYQKFLNKYAKGDEQERSKATVRKINTHIRACVKDAIDEGIIKIDFTRSAVLGGKKEKRGDEKHLHYDDSKRLATEIIKRLDKSISYYIMLIALVSGCRYAEIVGLTRKDFDFEKGTISINKTWGYKKEMHEGFGPTKNEQSVRTIAIDGNTMKIFKGLFENIPENIHKLVFYSRSSQYKVVANNTVNKTLRALLEELSIPNISVHGLRHTHASVLLYSGVSIYFVSERLGHGDLETTMNTYAHLVKELRQKDEEKTTEVFSEWVAS
ncbi:site-specific integrase [Aureibacillus halotolerans]|uniref:Site-specific recombinase XerD n=1 Tax=Aureibacillus halotolerans TaxID=1508390 RepID=A0A4R6TZ01_9BACI|nr:site-specific integrase [Aureibacillus halotolerans]TDQ39190.1 site-specific recombinase XerD [Aureibacillus halotolerans]